MATIKQLKSKADKVPRAKRGALKRPETPPHGGGSFHIVGVGASAGGLDAFTEFLKHLPADTGFAFVLVQHLDPQHASSLTQLLQRATAMPLQEVTDKLAVEANHIYVIPPNTRLSIERGVLKLRPRREDGGFHHTIDFFLESLAGDRQERGIGVIFSGTGTDGTLGLKAIKAGGGITFPQDESAKYDSMPRSAIASGVVDHVLSPANVAKELAAIANHPVITGAPRRKQPPGKLPCSPAVPVDSRRARGVDSKKSSCSSAVIPGWISRSTNRPLLSGALTAAWW